MPRIAYINKRFNATSIPIIEQADAICRQYAAQGLTLTLRQIYYQFVARGLMANKQTEYDRLGSILNDARLAGLLDWSHMEDRTRFLRRESMWRSTDDILRAVADQYKRDPWRTQDTHVEVWIEKDALVGVIENVCNENRVGHFACRGYVSQSEAWQASRRFLPHVKQGKNIVVLHLGDHDPSGIDMTRDNADRLNHFVEHDTGVMNPVDMRRLALNMNQVEQYDPPPNPAKMSDSRAADYVAEFGSSSWELDALEPTVIGALIQAELDTIIDPEPWAREMATEAREVAELTAISYNFDHLADYMRREGMLDND